MGTGMTRRRSSVAQAVVKLTGSTSVVFLGFFWACAGRTEPRLFMEVVRVCAALGMAEGMSNFR